MTVPVLAAAVSPTASAAIGFAASAPRLLNASVMNPPPPLDAPTTLPDLEPSRRTSSLV
jgi:hypothetical protein